MRAFLIIAFFSFSGLYGVAQSDEEKSLLEKLDNTTSDSLKADIYIDLYNAVFKTDLVKSQEYAKKVLEFGIKAGSLMLIQKGYIGLARCERKKRNYSAVYPIDLQSIEYAKKINNKKNLFSAYLLLSTDYLDDDKPAKALQCLTTCKQLEDSIDDPSYSANLSRLFGATLYKLNQNKRAIPYYHLALKIYQEQKDEKMIAEVKYLTALSFLAMKQPDSVIRLLYDALEIYKKRNSIGRQAECYGFLGQCYIMNGNIDKGIETYLKIIELFKASQDRIQEGLSYVDLARCYLIKKDQASAQKYGKLAEDILREMKYDHGIILVQTFWGQYCSETGEFNRAENYFREADSMASANQLPELKTDNEKYWAQYRYKAKNNKGADSLIYSYAKQLIDTKEASAINKDLALLIKKNPKLDSGTVKILKLLYSPGGAEFLQRKLGKTSLTDISKIDSVLSLNPYSLASYAYDSAVTVSDNKQLIEWETKFKTRLISDSLKIEKQNAIIAKKDIRQRNFVLAAALTGLLLLSAGLWLQYRNRKRAERDKAKIELLQNEIHHRVKNNLGVIRRLIDVAAKSGNDKISLQSLQNRVTAVELLHKRLYNDKMAGNISLQEYLGELTSAIQNTFETDKKIDIAINAPVAISSKVAEKIGLITNELVTNSYKYAFDNTDSGSIMIEASADSTSQYKIKISDNGKGMPHLPKSSYGLKLIKGLSNELGGHFTFANNNGAQFTLQFTDNG